MEGLEQGRVFSGREALTHKLIDQIGGEPEVVKYLEDQRGVPKGLKIVDWKVEPGQRLGLAARAPAGRWRASPGIRAFDELARIVNDDRIASLRLDGLLSIWHGSER